MKEMKVVDKRFDKKINALNVSLVMSIKDYVSPGKEIATKNEFQRARVRRSSSVYKLLRSDLKIGCLMPPIVLAVRTEVIKQPILNPQDIKDDEIISLLKAENLIILDCLQNFVIPT